MKSKENCFILFRPLFTTNWEKWLHLPPLPHMDLLDLEHLTHQPKVQQHFQCALGETHLLHNIPEVVEATDGHPLSNHYASSQPGSRCLPCTRLKRKPASGVPGTNGLLGRGGMGTMAGEAPLAGAYLEQWGGMNENFFSSLLNSGVPETCFLLGSLWGRKNKKKET